MLCPRDRRRQRGARGPGRREHAAEHVPGASGVHRGGWLGGEGLDIGISQNAAFAAEGDNCGASTGQCPRRYTGRVVAGDRPRFETVGHHEVAERQQSGKIPAQRGGVHHHPPATRPGGPCRRQRHVEPQIALHQQHIARRQARHEPKRRLLPQGVAARPGADDAVLPVGCHHQAGQVGRRAGLHPGDGEAFGGNGGADQRAFRLVAQRCEEEHHRAGKSKSRGSVSKLSFVIQRHKASHLHYDLRLEMDGVLKSWAIPKGPSMNPNDKRLAIMVEDHPYDYKNFKGIIPEGNYGAGIVEIWDEGFYSDIENSEKKIAEKKLLEELNEGSIKFNLYGKKLKGEFALVRMKNRGENTWLLLKHKDKFAVNEEYNSETKTTKNKLRYSICLTRLKNATFGNTFARVGKINKTPLIVAIAPTIQKIKIGIVKGVRRLIFFLINKKI